MFARQLQALSTVAEQLSCAAVWDRFIRPSSEWTEYKSHYPVLRDILKEFNADAQEARKNGLLPGP